MQFKLVTRQPTPKEIGLGVLRIDKSGTASFVSGRGEHDAPVLASMQSVRIDHANALGMMISGTQADGNGGMGEPKRSDQQWWLVYPGRP